jgi:hypothetical protein
MHHDDSVNSDDSEEEESGDDGELRWCSFRGCISEATNGGKCVRHSTTYDDDCLDQGGGEKKKRSLPSWDTANNESAIKRRRQQKNLFANDLSDVTPRFPIPKSSGRVNEGSSKYPGVHFDNQINKWAAYISIKWGAKNYWSLW